MLVHIVADNSTKLAGVRSLLDKKYDITSELLNGVGVQRSAVHALVVKADLRVLQNISSLRKILDGLPNVEKRIFLIDDAAHLSAAQAYALGASSVLQGPLNQAKLLKELANCLPAEPSSIDAQSTQAVASAGEVALASMFAAAASGTSIDVDGACKAGGRDFGRHRRTWLVEVACDCAKTPRGNVSTLPSCHGTCRRFWIEPRVSEERYRTAVFRGDVP